MGKSFCMVEKKWCKFLKRGVCTYSKENIKDVNRCPRLVEIETVRLYDLLHEVQFEDVFSRLTFWFDNQESSKEGYEEVFNGLLEKKPSKHKLDDLFIFIKKQRDPFDEEDEREYMYVSGIPVVGRDKRTYGIEFCGWDEWISMFITQDTLDTFTKEDIVAGCLYEMTFFGFTEDKVRGKMDQLIKASEEIRS